jgi:hypothetical protein
MSTSHRPSRRHACVVVVALSAAFALGCNLLLSVPDPGSLSGDDASAERPEAGRLAPDVSVSEVAVAPGDAPSEDTSGDAPGEDTSTADCTPDLACGPPLVCHLGGFTSCASGVSVCVAGPLVIDGTSCGADKVCVHGACSADSSLDAGPPTPPVCDAGQIGGACSDDVGS